MSTIRFIAVGWSILLFLGAFTGHAQGTFQNLDFEQTALNPQGPPTVVPIAQGLPGWIGFLGTSPPSQVLLNNATLGSSAIALLGQGNSLAPVIAGHFRVFLLADADRRDSTTPLDVALGQSGMVPVGARYLQFAACFGGGQGGIGDFRVTLGGQSISMVPPQTTPDCTLYSGRIASFAGQVAELRITALANLPQGLTVMGLDSITFSSVPEPGAWGLLALGAVLLAWRRGSGRGGSPWLPMRWQGSSRWWIIQTAESYNGKRTEAGQRNSIKRFSVSSLGRANYSNTRSGCDPSVKAGVPERARAL